MTLYDAFLLLSFLGLLLSPFAFNAWNRWMDAREERRLDHRETRLAFADDTPHHSVL